jgi:hypothetical protein
VIDGIGEVPHIFYYAGVLSMRQHCVVAKILRDDSAMALLNSRCVE